MGIYVTEFDFDSPRAYEAVFLTVDPRDNGEYIVKKLSPSGKLGRTGTVWPTGTRKAVGGPRYKDIGSTEFNGFSAKEGSTVEVKYVNPETKAEEWCQAIYLLTGAPYTYVGVMFLDLPSIWGGEPERDMFGRIVLPTPKGMRRCYFTGKFKPKHEYDSDSTQTESEEAYERKNKLRKLKLKWVQKVHGVAKDMVRQVRR